MKKRMEVTGQTRQNLMDAFWSLYCEKRIEKITVREVTGRAGYNRGTFYEYFTDVYEVLDQIEAGLIPSLDALPPVSTPSGSFGMPIDLFFELFRKNRSYYAVLLGEGGDPSFAGRLKSSIKPTLMQVFEDDPEVDRKELEYILEYTLSAMIGIMSYWFEQPEPLSSEKLYGLVNRLMEQGVVRQLSFPGDRQGKEGEEGKEGKGR